MRKLGTIAVLLVIAAVLYAIPASSAVIRAYKSEGPISPSDNTSLCLTATGLNAKSPVKVLPCVKVDGKVGDAMQLWTAGQFSHVLIVVLTAHPGWCLGGIPLGGARGTKLVLHDCLKREPLVTFAQSMRIYGAPGPDGPFNWVRNLRKDYMTAGSGHLVVWGPKEGTWKWKFDDGWQIVEQ